MGASSNENGHTKFDSFVRELMTGKDPPSAVGKIECPIPPEGLVYDYLFEVREVEEFCFSHYHTHVILWYSVLCMYVLHMQS